MKHFDVVHVHPSARRNAPGFLFMPAGAVPLMNELRTHGFDVASINEPMEMLRNNGWSLEACLSQYKAPLYAIDIHWHEHIHSGLCIAELIKRLYPKSRVAVGGLTATHFAADLLRTCPAIDYVVAGYGEGQLLRLADRATRRPDVREVIYSHTPPKMDDYDYVTCDWMLHWEDYMHCAIDTWMEDASVWWLKNGMGCSLNCAFCGGSRSAQKSIFGNNKVVQRDATMVAADIMALSKRGIQRVALIQDPNLAPKTYWRRLHREVRKYDARPAVYIEAVGAPSEEYLADFAATFDLRNSVITLWPLCATESVRSRYGKPISDRQIFACLQSMRRLGIQCILYLTYQLEPPTLQTRIRHDQFVREATDAYGEFNLLESYVIVDPASHIAQSPEHYGVDVTLCTSDDYITRARLRTLGQPYDRLGYSLASRTN